MEDQPIIVALAPQDPAVARRNLPAANLDELAQGERILQFDSCAMLRQVGQCRGQVQPVDPDHHRTVQRKTKLPLGERAGLVDQGSRVDRSLAEAKPGMIVALPHGLYRMAFARTQLDCKGARSRQGVNT